MQRPVIVFIAIVAAVAGFLISQKNAPLPAQTAKVYASDLAGEAVDVTAGSGKLKLVNFWASWCAPCVEELPLLESYAKDNTDTLEVLAVAIDTLAHVNEFLEKHPLELPVAVGTSYATELMVDWGNDITALPFTALLDADGNLVRVHSGAFDAKALDAFVH